MTDYTDPELVALRKALIAAWTLLGRCDATLETLANPHLSAAGRRALILKMRAEIARAMGSAQ